MDFQKKINLAISLLSRKIALYHEPEPTWKYVDGMAQPFDVTKPPVRPKWWYYDVGKDCWHPFPIDRAEIAMRLLEWIIEHDKRAIPDERIIKSYFEIRDRKQIALAFAKSARIETEE